MSLSALLLGIPLVIHAAVPEADRVEGAVAEANRASKRTQALQLEMSLRIGDGEPVAVGEIVSHPTGLARLELRAGGDLIERHLLRGAEHAASRNGRPLSNPRAFLPPLFLLQADSALTLRSALRAYGVAFDAIGLAPCGNSDCFVIGDPARVTPPHMPGQLRERPPLEPRPPADPRAASGHAAVWIDSETYAVVRIDSADGIRVTLGPPAAFEQVQFPQWIRVEEPEQRPVRFEIRRATPVNAPPQAFSDVWLQDSGATEAPAAADEQP